MHDARDFLETLSLVLCVAAATTVLFQRLKQPVVLGYLLAGMLVGPYVPIPLEANTGIVQTLAELGVILLMFSLGVEFSLQKLLHVGATAGFVAVVQCSLMLWLGYLIGQALGWDQLTSVYAGAVISISSTTIIVKVFEEQRIKADFRHIVFGVLIVEDLIAIMLITILTAVSSGQKLRAAEVATTAGGLAAFLIVMIVAGMLTVPRIMRAVVRLDRDETTVVASVGLAFGFALLAYAFGYSVALGAFIAGSLVAESGVEKTVEHLVKPVRDIFAAIFFVSVGMLIDPSEILAHLPAVAIFFVAVVVGKVISVTLGAVLTGQSVQTSLKTGMSLAQIGEFSFIIAGVGLASGATDHLLYSLAVAVSGLTTLTTPWLIRAAEPTAAYVDRKLPRALQTFVALYGSWLEQLGTDTTADGQASRVRRLARWLAGDAAVVAAITIGTSLELPHLAELAQDRWEMSAGMATLLVVAAAISISSPFWIGMIRVARHLGFELADRVFPTADGKAADLAAAPRRLLIVTLQLAIVVLVSLPLLAITQPFLPPLRGAVVVVLLLVLLALSFWRSAANLQGHTRAAAQAIAQMLAQQTQQGHAARAGQKIDAQELLAGLGSPVSVPIAAGSSAVGKTLAELNLRGLTGATVLAIQRPEHPVVVPSGEDRIAAGDVLAVAGTTTAVESARRLLAG